MSALTFRGVSVRYPQAQHPALHDVSFAVGEGEVVLLLGPSASGKSTLLRCANGLVPHATGGHMSGEVVVFGRTVSTHRPRELADVVGFVHQDPEAQFVTDRVEADVAFVLDNLRVDAVTLRRRVEEALDALGVAHLRGRMPTELSGGERQRCAIAGALAAAPRALVLDEPTSQLDPQGAEDVLAAVARLNADLGTTVLLAEHRLERVAAMADRAVLLEQGQLRDLGPAREVLSGYGGAAPVTRLGALFGWQPVPLTVREARKHAQTLPPLPPPPSSVRASAPGDVVVQGQQLRVRLGGRDVLDGVSVELRQGEIVALLGRNGAGKTTLLRALADLQPLVSGHVHATGRVAFVPQDPTSLLFASSAAQEVAHTLRLLGRTDADQVHMTLARFGLQNAAARHPRSLSGGERQRLAVAAVMVGEPAVMLLDEPTRGIDAESRDALQHALRAHANDGGAAVVATHDVELAASLADRVLVLGDGELLAEGETRQVLTGSLFAPQILRVLPPLLTFEEAAAVHAQITATDVPTQS